MHTMLFSKKEINLHCCYNEHELISLLMYLFSDSIKTGNKHKIVILLDHILDGSQGIEVLKKANSVRDKFNLDIIWVLLSSTEDNETIEKYVN